MFNRKRLAAIGCAALLGLTAIPVYAGDSGWSINIWTRHRPQPQAHRQPKLHYDDRIKCALDEMGYRYKIERNGDFIVTVQTARHRSQTLVIASDANRYDTAELRQITTTAGRFDDCLDPAISHDLLLENADVPFGAWSVSRDRGNDYVINFQTKLSVNADTHTLRRVLTTMASIADQKELDLDDSRRPRDVF